MIALPRCPETLPTSLAERICELGLAWSNCSDRPRIDDQTLEEWTNLISAWASDISLPLLVRKSSLVRGAEVIHTSGRVIIPCDNSPAQWACHLALRGHVPTINEIREGFQNDKIPVSFAHKSDERTRRKYHCTLGQFTINKAGWKLCHIDSVGLRTRDSLSDAPIQSLTKAFFDLLEPKNFFLLPMSWGGLGEAPEFISAFKRNNRQS